MSFSSDLDKAYEKKVERAMNQTVRKVSLDLLSNLVAQTPVDTGLARRNWILTTNTPAFGTKEDIDGDPVLEGNQAISGYNAFMGGDVWISNNLPYIERLNNGWSEKVTPQVGWVDAEVSKALRQVKTVFKALS